MKRYFLNGVMDVTGWIVLGFTAVVLVILVVDALRDKHKFIRGNIDE